MYFYFRRTIPNCSKLKKLQVYVKYRFKNWIVETRHLLPDTITVSNKSLLAFSVNSAKWYSDAGYCVAKWLNLKIREKNNWRECSLRFNLQYNVKYFRFDFQGWQLFGRNLFEIPCIFAQKISNDHKNTLEDVDAS